MACVILILGSHPQSLKILMTDSEQYCKGKVKETLRKWKDFET